MYSKDEQNLAREREYKRLRYIVFLLIFLLVLFFATFSITFSIYKGNSGENSEIITDKIIFSYSDVDQVGNGININDAMPITDTIGKTLIGKSQYFDFNVNATSKNTNILYKILVKKSDVSTLADSKVRIYLTELFGSFEREVILTDFSNLKRLTLNGIDYYVLAEKKLNKGIENYTDYYRLRMWIREDAVDFLDQKFSIKVDVHAEQIGD